MADAKAIVERLYQAFNDSGFLGMGGTDEEGALDALRTAKDRGVMKEVDSLYAKTYPDEPNLKDEIDDELSGEDFDAAMKLYDEGMKAEPKAQPAAAAGGGQGAGGGTGKTPEPQLRVNGTLTPGGGAIRVCLLGFDRKPLPNGRCRIGFVGIGGSAFAYPPKPIYTADEAGVVTLPVPSGKEVLDIEWSAAPEGGSGALCFYHQRAIRIKVEGEGDDAIRNQLLNLGFAGGSVGEQLNHYHAYFGGEGEPDADSMRAELDLWVRAQESPAPDRDARTLESRNA